MFCTARVPPPGPTVNLGTLFGAIQTQMIYHYLEIILLLTDIWMYPVTNGMFLPLFIDTKF